MLDPVYEEGKTEGHSREENVLGTGIKVEAELQGTGITTDCFLSIKQEELHIKNELPNVLAVDEDSNNTEFRCSRVKPFTESLDLASKNNCEAGTSECKTNLVLNTEIPTSSKKRKSKCKSTSCLHSRHDSLCIDEACEGGSDASSSHKTKLKNGASGKQFQCNLCDVNFTYRSHLQKHLRIHTGEKPFECDLCEFKSSQQSYLKTHMRIHTGEKPFECDLCEFKSSQKSYLKKHMRIHTGEKPFKCDLCEFKATRKSQLQTHMPVHTREKPFECNLCEFKSTQKADLQKHMLIHTGEKPFVCDLCECKFRQQSHLKSHMRIHTGERPFECDLCEFKSAYKTRLQTHMHIHTRE